MGSGPPRARQSRSLPSLMPLWLKRLLIRPSDERSPISERKFPLANNRRRRLLAFFTRPRSTNGGRSSKRRESRRSESGHRSARIECPLCAKSGHYAVQQSIAPIGACTAEFSPVVGAGCKAPAHSHHILSLVLSVLPHPARGR